MKYLKKFYLIVVLTIGCVFVSNSNELFAQKKHVDVGIEERLGAHIPMNLKFYTSDGDTVAFKDFIRKPFLLDLVYYECPGICSPLLTELAWVVDKVDLEPGKDFQVVALSFDHHEKPPLAAKWKKNYLAAIKRPFPDSDWVFLTGDSANIKALADSVGFYFKPMQKDFTHAGCVIAISPDGKVSRYLYGPTFNQFDVKMALLDAGAGRTNPAIVKLVQYCFSYDPHGRKYTLNVTRIAGTILLIGIGLTVSILTFKKRKKNKRTKEFE